MADVDSSGRIPRWRKFLLVLSGIGLCLASLTLYLQTQHAFKHLIVPLLERFIPGQLEIQKGSLTFPAALKLAGLSYQQPDVGLSVQIDQLLVQISVMAWLRQRLLLVEALDLKNGKLHMTSGMTSPPQQRHPTVTTSGTTAVMVPFAVQRARLENVTLSIQTGSDDFTARDMQVAIDNVRPGRTGTITVSSEMALKRSASQTRWAGALLVTGNLAESSDGWQLKWDLANELTVREWPGHVALAGSTALRLDQTLSGHYDFMQATVHADSSLTLREGETSLGALSLTFTRTPSPDGTVMDVEMKIQEITDAAFNLFQNNAGVFRLRSAHMGGSLYMHAIGERYDIRSTFTGQKLQAVLGENTTPPLDIDVAQTGIFDVASRNGTLDILELRVAEGDHVRLAGELKHPVTINLDTDGVTRAGVSTQNASQADWMLTVYDIDVAELRQWGAVFSWKGLPGVRTGQLRGVATVSSRDNGNAIDLNTRLTISNVRMGSADKRADNAPLKFDTDIHGTVTNLTMLQLHSGMMTASVHDRSVGTVRLSGAINLKAPSRDPRLGGSLTLADLPGEACNPLLALWSDVRIDRARFNGKAEVKTNGDLISWAIDLRGNQVSLRFPELHHAPVPLDLSVSQSGSFDRTTGVLRLEKILLQELERSRPVITAALDKPVHFVLPGKEPDGKKPQSPNGQVANFTVEVRHLGIDQLRPRLAVWGISALDSMKTGVIDGRWVIQGQEGASILSVTGSLDITDLRLDTGTIHISTPLVMRSRVYASITEFSRIRLEALRVKARAATSLIAEAEFTGQTDVTDGSTNLAVTFNADNMAKLLDGIGLLDEGQRKGFTGGKVSAEGRLSGRGQQSPISAEATIRIREFRFQPSQDQFLTYSLLTQATLELNAAGTDLEFKRIVVTLDSQGKTAGTLNLSGTWPIAPSHQGGVITVATKDLDTAPLVDIFRIFPGRDHGPLLLNANVAIARNSASGSLVVRGQETLGPIRLARKGEDGGPNATTLRIEHDLSRHDDEIRAAALTMTTDRPGGRADRVTASGTVRIAGPPGAQLRGEIAALDAAWYEALFSDPEPRPQTMTNQAGKKDRGGQPEPSNSPPLLANLDAELSIGSVSYRTLKIGPGRLVAKGTGAQLEVNLEPTGFANGQVEATVTLVRQDRNTAFTWSGKGQGLSVETILQAAEPGQAAKLRGTGSLTTSGHGRSNEAPFGKHLTGNIDFTVADGQFIRSPVLHFLANYTHIQELDQMGFADLQGKVRLEDGWIHADSLTATGPIATLEGDMSVSPDSKVDGRIFVKIGPSLGNKIKIPCMSALLKTPDGFTALPFAVRIKGPTEDLSYSIETAAWDYTKGAITSLADTMKHLLRGCREDPSEKGAK